jgi:hypothetical protein
MPKPTRQTAPKGKSVSFASAAPDARFAALSSDPRYRLPSKKRTHIKLDKRLGGILKDDEFSRKASVDRYGRKVAKGQEKKKLERLYRLASDDEEDDDGEVLEELAKVGRKYDPARDGGFSTSESESESEEDDSDVESEIDAELPETAEDVPMGEVSSRLAVVNLDWDNITAEDIMSVAASFAGPEGKIISVAIYPSEFGRERMEKEEMEGPPKEIFQSDSSRSEIKRSAGKPSKIEEYSEDEDSAGSSEDEAIKKQLLEEDTGAEFDSVALRKYQLDRLRYYYAVITCSSKVVAKALYDNMDGQEYLSSANFFDMRFIPDDVDFENDRFRELCKKVPEGYKPSEFTTDALMHSNVKLTWDADDTKRKEAQKRAFSRKEIDENDLQAYLGSGSSSEEEDEDEEIDENDPEADVKSTTSRATTRQERREALRAALGLDLEPSNSKREKREANPVGDMQITFTPALSSTTKNGTVFENEPPPPEETTHERYVRKERERKAVRKERMKAKRAGLDPDEVPAVAEENEEEAIAESADDAENDEDPFNDPFFENPTAANDKSKAERRKEKERKKQAAKEVADALSKAERAELELVMLDDGAQTASNKHFDIRAIEKAEKKARKSEKKGAKKDKKHSKHAGEDEQKPDAFDINTKDERFTKLFEDPAFAIDPTNPKFRDTKGMRAILGEKRKRGEYRVASTDKKGSNGLVDSMKETAERIGKRLKVKS